jgi:hypothetical protein
MLGVGEVPSAAAVVVGPVITFARKIDPFWVPELVAHEREVSFAT